MKIGIMGGTFNPIHNGHLMLAEYAYRQYELDEIWFMPNGNPPHKSDPHIIQATIDRLKMTELAVSDIPYFKVSDHELNKKEKCYSYQTFSELKTLYPEDVFFFIIGADSLFHIETWKHPEILIPEVTILAAFRDDVDTLAEMDAQIDYLNKKYNGDIRLLKTPVLKISSHEIREQIHEGSELPLPVPKKVKEYIDSKHLYQGEIYE